MSVVLPRSSLGRLHTYSSPAASGLDISGGCSSEPSSVTPVKIPLTFLDPTYCGLVGPSASWPWIKCWPIQKNNQCSTQAIARNWRPALNEGSSLKSTPQKISSGKKKRKRGQPYPRDWESGFYFRNTFWDLGLCFQHLGRVISHQGPSLPQPGPGLLWRAGNVNIWGSLLSPRPDCRVLWTAEAWGGWSLMVSENHDMPTSRSPFLLSPLPEAHSGMGVLRGQP